MTDKHHTEVMFAFDDLEQQMQRLEQLLVYADDSHREIATINLLVARNIPVTFAKPVSDVISELEKNPAPPEPTPAPKETKSAVAEIPVRRAQSIEPTVRKATAVSPGVQKYHSRPTPAPVRKAVPLQRFNEGSDGNG